MIKKILLTGSAGFIGSNFVEHIIQNSPEFTWISIDKLVEPHNFFNVPTNHKFYLGDIADENFLNSIFKIEKPTFVIHLAAESFVDNSIQNAKKFIYSNVMGTQNIVDVCIKYNVEKLLYGGTDESYGQLKLDEPGWTEESPCNPRNPYSASKVCGELIVKAAGETHGLNYVISRSSNVYGKFQPNRNLVPKIIYSLLENKSIPISGSGLQQREWLFAPDHCDALMQILLKGISQNIYNIGSGFEMKNLEMVKYISDYLSIQPIISHVADRKAHDFRYLTNCAKIHNLGWKPKYTFEQGMGKCIDWYVENKWYLNV